MDIKKRVLVVDDEPGILKVLSIELRLQGYEVESTTSGAEAIEMIRSREPDLVLLDVLMPEVSGLEVLDSVREFSRVPIILFTANHRVIEIAMKMGGTDYITKPFNVEHLDKKIKTLLDACLGA